MIEREAPATAPYAWWAEGRARIATAAATVERWPVLRVLGALVVVEWLAVLALALTVRHSGWIYYQGGDQLWYYTLGWLLGHGQLTQTTVGYGWPVVLTPISWVAGPNLVHALPAIVLLDVLVLLPVAMLALYGIASRIGGRLFGYWALLVWIVAPFVGILITNAGYHQRYTELTLPQSFGLTAMADFPTMVAALVSLYFVARILSSERPVLFDAVAGGAAAGLAIAVKPSTSIFLVGPALAFAYRRAVVPAAVYTLALLPSVLALAVWKERGLGQVPILGAPGSPRGDLASAAPLAGLDLHRYFQNVSWQQFTRNLDLLREHFWSARLLEWLVVAGLIALARRSRGYLLLVGGSFAAFVVVKGGYTHASVEDSSVFRVMMPAFPCFVLLLASLPFLLPRVAARVPAWAPTRAETAARTRWAVVGAVVLLTAIVPMAAFAAARTDGPRAPVTLGLTNMPVPNDVDVGLRASVRNGIVRLEWNGQSRFGGPVFYRVWRGRGDGLSCPSSSGAKLCNVTLPEVRVTRATTVVDTPARGRWVYRIAVAANWLDDPQYGDPYVVSRTLAVTVP